VPFVHLIDIGDMIYYISKLKLHKAAGTHDIVNEHVIFDGNHLIKSICAYCSTAC